MRDQAFTDPSLLLASKHSKLKCSNAHAQSSREISLRYYVSVSYRLDQRVILKPAEMDSIIQGILFFLTIIFDTNQTFYETRYLQCWSKSLEYTRIFNFCLK